MATVKFGKSIDPKPTHTLSDVQCMIYRDDRFVCQQPSLEFAYKWIDNQFAQAYMAYLSYQGY